MNIGIGIYAILKANAAVIALIGSGDNCRAYPLMIPQTKAIPAIIYELISTQPFPTKSGVSTADHSVYDLICVDDTYDGAVAVAVAVRAAMDGIRNATHGGIYFDHIILRDSRDQAVEVDGIPKYARALSFELRAKNT